MKNSILQKTAVILLISALTFGTVGCGTEWEGMLLDLLGEWADQHDINPSTPGGAANLARRTASGSTGDEEADAAIDYDTIIDNIEKEGEEPEEDNSPPTETTDATVKKDESTSPGTTISENPDSHVEGFLADESSGGNTGAEAETPGLTWSETVDELSKNVKSPSSVTAESSEEVFEKIKDLIYQEDPETGRFERTRTSGHDVAEIELQNGEKMKVGILVTPEGRILYTSNGKDYYPDLENITDPGLTQQISEAYSDIKDRAWNRAFEGGSRDPDINLQERVASEVMDDLRTQLDAGETPKSVADWTEGQLWDSQVKGPLEKKLHETLWEQAEARLKAALIQGSFETPDGTIHIITDKNKRALDLFEDLKNQLDSGDVTSLDTYTSGAWNQVKQETGLDLFELTEAGGLAVSGAEFALESVKTMGRGLQDKDFALRCNAYIAERQKGNSPQAIWDKLSTDDVLYGELVVGGGKVISGGTSSMMASSGVAREAQMGVMFTMFEQTYQRYLIAKGLGK